MGRSLRFAAALLVGLALVTWAASSVVHRTMASWFESDLRLRSHAAIDGAHQGLVEGFGAKKTTAIEKTLTGITRSARVMGAEACDRGGAPVSGTFDMPTRASCDSIVGPLARAQREEAWFGTIPLAAGAVHVSAIPVRDSTKFLGWVVLAQDLSYAQRRDAMAQRIVFVSLGVLALAAALVTVAAAYWSRRDWNEGMRRLLRGEIARPEFRPFLREVGEFVDSLIVARETTDDGGAWTPDRLKAALDRYLHGEKVVIVANREPYIHSRVNGNGIEVLHPASGLVTALEPVMRACSGVWIAHGSGNADREMVDRHDRIRVPPGDEAYVLRRVWLTPEQEQGYYFGFANEGLWPLCHLADVRPVFRSEDWKQYHEVNERFVQAVTEEIDADDPIILVQDYHFALVPRLVRERLPRATVLMFWHIPWPNAERFGICPYRDEILEGMLGSSIVGFHTSEHCNNFLDSVDRYLESRIDHERNAIVRQGITTLVRAYPISLEWPSRWARRAPPVEECRRSLRAALGLPDDALVGVGVDRLDYTKGVEERLLAVERLLERKPHYRGRFTFVQLASPSRTVIERYRLLNEAVDRLAARINERFGEGEYKPIVLRRAHHEPPSVYRYYRGADMCYVSSLHDGMNLVAKEFIAARDDEQGVLVLSQFTGAARELTEALIVNPYDLDEASDALAAALEMSPEEQRVRMRAMRRSIANANVYRWAGHMIEDAALLRRRERISDRLVAIPPTTALADR